MPSAAGYHRQGTLATDNSGVAATTIIATLPSPVANGSLVIVTVGWFSVASNTGADFPQVTADTTLPSAFGMQIATAADTFGMWTHMYANTMTGPQQFTITFDVATKFQWLAIDEYISTPAGPFPIPYDNIAVDTLNSVTFGMGSGNEIIYVSGFSTSGGSATPGTGFEGRQSGSLSGNNTFFLTEDDFEVVQNPLLTASFDTTGSTAVCLISAVSILTNQLGLQIIPVQWSDSWRDIAAMPAD